ncbi:MAG: AraC family ligand binding domain-containing protein, partial [Eubacteriales bacterium]
MKCAELITYASEHCRSDKLLTKGYPSSFMMHFIQSGSGYYNGRRISAGQGFITPCGAYTEYYPDKDDPWYYAWVNYTDPAMLEEVRTLFFLDDDMVFSFDTEKPYVKQIEA